MRRVASPLLLLPAFPLALATAVLIGMGEHAIALHELAALVNPDGGPPASLLILLVMVTIDLMALGAGLNGVVRGLARYRRMDGPAPWAPAAALACANALCLGCSLPFGALALWASLLRLALWVMMGGE